MNRNSLLRRETLTVIALAKNLNITSLRISFPNLKLLGAGLISNISTMSPKNRRGGSGGPASREITVSKAMSFVLRHGAEKEGIKLNKQGYANVADLVNPPLSLSSPFSTALSTQPYLTIFSDH